MAKDQTPGTNKYFLVGVYTYPVNKKGKPLLLRPDQDEEEDHPLPGLDDPELSGDPQEQQPGDGQPPQQHGERDQQQAAMKLDMNKVSLQELRKMNLILSKKNRFLTLWKMKK